MVDTEFCEYLENRISKALANSRDDKLRQFWCDGVLLPTFEGEYAEKFVNDKRKIALMVYAGITGQDKYELTLHFGNKALSRYSRGLDIFECVPNTEDENWFSIDTENFTMEIQLY